MEDTASSDWLLAHRIMLVLYMHYSVMIIVTEATCPSSSDALDVLR